MKKYEDKRDEICERIINEALRLFGEESFKFTMDEIAKNLSISKKTIYKNFENKEVLIVGCIDVVFEDIYEKHGNIAKEDIIPLKKLKKTLAVYPSVYNVESISLEDLTSFPQAINRIEMHLNSNWDNTLKLLDECKESGVIKDIDHNCFKLIMVGLFKGCLQDNNHHDVLEKCIEYIFDGLIN